MSPVRSTSMVQQHTLARDPTSPHQSTRVASFTTHASSGNSNDFRLSTSSPLQAPSATSSAPITDDYPFVANDTTVEAIFECREANYLLYDILRHDTDSQNRLQFDRAVKDGVVSYLRGTGLRVRDSDIWTQVRPGLASRLLLSHPGRGGMPTVTDGQWPLRFRVVVCAAPRDEDATRRQLLGIPSNVFDQAFSLYELWFGRAVIGSPVSLVDTHSAATLVNGMQAITTSAALPNAQQHRHKPLTSDAAWSTSVDAPLRDEPLRNINSVQQRSMIYASGLQPVPASPSPPPPSQRASLGLVEANNQPPVSTPHQYSRLSQYETPGSSRIAVDDRGVAEHGESVHLYRKHPSVLPPARKAPPTTFEPTVNSASTTQTVPRGLVEETHQQVSERSSVVQQQKYGAGPRYDDVHQLSRPTTFNHDDDDDILRYGERREREPLTKLVSSSKSTPREAASNNESRNILNTRGRYDARYGDTVSPVSPARRRNHSDSPDRRSPRTHRQHSSRRSSRYNERYMDCHSDAIGGERSDSDDSHRYDTKRRHSDIRGDRNGMPPRRSDDHHYREPASRRDEGERRYHRQTDSAQIGALVPMDDRDEHHHPTLYTNRDSTEFFVRVRNLSEGNRSPREVARGARGYHQGHRQLVSPSSRQRRQHRDN